MLIERELPGCSDKPQNVSEDSEFDLKFKSKDVDFSQEPKEVKRKISFKSKVSKDLKKSTSEQDFSQYNQQLESISELLHQNSREPQIQQEFNHGKDGKDGKQAMEVVRD